MAWRRRVPTFQADNNLSGQFELGPTLHRVLVGVDYAKGTIRNDSYRMSPVAFDPFDPDRYRPDVPSDFSDSKTNWPGVRQEFTRVGLYLQDQIAYEKWRLTLRRAPRWSTLDDESRSYAPQWSAVAPERAQMERPGRAELSVRQRRGALHQPCHLVRSRAGQ